MKSKREMYLTAILDEIILRKITNDSLQMIPLQAVVRQQKGLQLIVKFKIGINLECAIGKTGTIEKGITYVQEVIKEFINIRNCSDLLNFSSKVKNE